MVSKVKRTDAVQRCLLSLASAEMSRCLACLWVCLHWAHRNKREVQQRSQEAQKVLRADPFRFFVLIAPVKPVNAVKLIRYGILNTGDFPPKLYCQLL